MIDVAFTVVTVPLTLSDPLTVRSPKRVSVTPDLPRVVPAYAAPPPIVNAVCVEPVPILIVVVLLSDQSDAAPPPPAGSATTDREIIASVSGIEILCALLATLFKAYTVAI